jgi:hypothetical protein
MANYIKNLPANWRLENWYGLVRIESEMRGCAEWNTRCANTSYSDEARNSNPNIMKLYNEVMQRTSRCLAKAERVAEYRNARHPNGAPALVEAVPHVNPKPNGDEPAILLAAAGIMEQRGIHVTARKLIDMAHDIEAELGL